RVLYFIFFLMIRPPPLSTLFPYTTLFRSLDFSLTDKGTGIKGNRTVTFDDFRTGVAQPDSIYAGPSVVKVFQESDTTLDETYWTTHRPIALKPNEQNIYRNIDTLQLIPSFQRFMDISALILSGYKQAGPVEVGP